MYYIGSLLYFPFKWYYAFYWATETAAADDSHEWSISRDNSISKLSLIVPCCYLTTCFRMNVLLFSEQSIPVILYTCDFNRYVCTYIMSNFAVFIDSLFHREKGEKLFRKTTRKLRYWWKEHYFRGYGDKGSVFYFLFVIKSGWELSANRNTSVYVIQHFFFARPAAVCRQVELSCHYCKKVTTLHRMSFIFLSRAVRERVESFCSFLVRGWGWNII